ncbi:D-alanyl-D-alanine carboxypeptidase DacB [bioreactor metagenome]|uniref:serine-type D-Ala-D-Ala carboxypeptidase n=1 Tax=bioreactor metagenome TaxID=1076179 RepID=A0A644SV94_9ZZZZ
MLGKTKLVIIIFFVCLGLVCQHAAAASPPQISAKTAILLDAKTGQIIYDKQGSLRCAPASTTKILTAIIAIESGRLDEVVTVSARAAGTGGSSLQLYANQKIPLRELVTGLMLRSGNDAAVAIAEHLAGSVDNFVLLMNHTAQQLGAYNSHFRNPNGLNAPGHFSTAFDLAWMARYALTNKEFADIVNTRETTIEWLDHKGHSRDRNLRNTNKLLWMLEEADGVKTGTTGEAGPCLVSSATLGSQKLIAVVLHDHSRWYDSMKLLKYGFDNFDLYEYAEQDAVLAPLAVEKGTQPTLDAIVASPAALVVPTDDFQYVTVEVDLPEKIKAPVYKGQKIGEIVFFVREKAVKSVDLIAGQEVPEKTATRIFFSHLLETFRWLSGWGVL